MSPSRRFKASESQISIACWTWFAASPVSSYICRVGLFLFVCFPDCSLFVEEIVLRYCPPHWIWPIASLWCVDGIPLGPRYFLEARREDWEKSDQSWVPWTLIFTRTRHGYVHGIWLSLCDVRPVGRFGQPVMRPLESSRERFASGFGSYCCSCLDFMGGRKTVTCKFCHFFPWLLAGILLKTTCPRQLKRNALFFPFIYQILHNEHASQMLLLFMAFSLLSIMRDSWIFNTVEGRVVPMTSPGWVISQKDRFQNTGLR